MTAEGYEFSSLSPAGVFIKIWMLTASCDALHVLVCESSVQHEAPGF